MSDDRLAARVSASCSVSPRRTWPPSASEEKRCGSGARISFAKQLAATMAGKKVGRGMGRNMGRGRSRPMGFIDRALLAQGLVVGTNSGACGSAAARGTLT